MIKLKNIITEEVYGNKATVYHRTESSQLLSIILYNDFKHSSGMYGKGIYTTYEPTEKTDWTVPNPKTGDPAKDNPEGKYNYYAYGKYQVKFSVDLINFFIFDWDVYKEVKPHIAKVEKFTKKKSDINNFINLQAEYFKMPYRINTEYRKRYTSEIALEFGFESDYKYSDSSLLNGIVFFGSHDGNVLVCYNKDMIVPLSITNSDTNETINLQKMLDSDLTLKDKFKDYFKKFMQIKNKTMSNVKNPIIERAKKIWVYDETTGLFSFDGNVEITREFITNDRLAIKFDKVHGDFYFDDCDKLQSLEGCPQIVGGSFNCSWLEKIKSLEGCPREVGGDFYCMHCESLESLKGSSIKIGGYFMCDDCKSLKSLDYLPRARYYDVPNNFKDELEDIRRERGEIK